MCGLHRARCSRVVAPFHEPEEISIEGDRSFELHIVGEALQLVSCHRDSQPEV